MLILGTLRPQHKVRFKKRPSLCASLHLFVLLSIALLSGQTVFAGDLDNNVLLLSSGNAGQFSVTSHTRFYDPGLQNPNLENVVQLPDTHWSTLDQRSASMVLHPRHAIWYRIAIRNDGSETQTLILRDSNPLTDTMSSYLCLQPNNAHACKKNSSLPYNKNLQTLSLAPEQSATLLIEAAGFHSFFFSLSLQTPSAFTSQQYRQRIYFSLLDGILCGLALYSLLIAIHTKQKAYFAYYIFGSSLTATFFIHQDFFRTFIGIFPNTWLTNLSVIMPLLDGAALAFFIGYYLYVDNIAKPALLALRLYISAVIVVGVGFLLQVPTILLVPIYVVTTLLALSYFFFLCLIERHQPRLGIGLLCIGTMLPFFNFLTTLLASLGVIHIAENFLVMVQSIEAASTSLFASAILLSIKHLQENNEVQARIAAKASITGDVHNQLLSHLNHELRTPLNGILGAAEILMHKSHHPKDRRVFRMIYHTALPLKHLIEDMVNIKSITKNQKALQNTRFDLHNLLQECMDIFLLTAHEKKIRLYFQINNNVTSDITADTNRLRQILINLIGNACKFTNGGIVGLHVSQEAGSTTNEHLYHFEVIDSGQGINEADEKKLFEIFETGHSGINPKGTGVGLSIVRELSHMMGGSCGYRKNAAAGSTFWFSVKVTTHHNILRKTHGAFAGLNILLADKDTDLMDSIYEKISDAVNTLIAANSEQQIISALEEIDGHSKYTGEKSIDIALIHNALAEEHIINAILSAGIPLLVYEDYDEITSNAKAIESKKGYEVITRKPSVETFSLNIAEAIIRKDNVIHKYSEKMDVRHKTILIAEDIPTNLLIIEEIIKSIGLSSVTCCNGKQALETFIHYHQTESAFSTIIMDCEMPVMDGFESTEKIRLYEKTHQLKPSLIIALSAHAEPEYRLRSKQSGMDLYLTKPVSADILIQHIENHRRSLV